MYPQLVIPCHAGGPRRSAWYANPNRQQDMGRGGYGRDSFGAGDAPFHTCTATSASTQMSFLVWREPLAAIGVLQQADGGTDSGRPLPVVDSTAPYFRTGKAGAAYFVAGSGRHGRLAAGL